METTHEYPLMVARSSMGRKFWQIRVLVEGDRAFTQTVSYKETARGKSSPVVSEPAESFPKNVGRSNETSALEQAMADAESKISKKRDKGYWVDGKPEPKKRILPMLAQQLSDHESKVAYPVAVEPKADGVRMLFDGHNGWSRSGKDWIEGVIEHLRFDTQGHILDGELMLPLDKGTFQEGVSATKRAQPLSKELVFKVFDIADETGTLSFQERRRILEKMDLPKQVVLIEQHIANSRDDINRLYKMFLANGHEGAMVKLLDRPYKPGPTKSTHMLKVKPKFDEEFEIVKVVDGVGKFQGVPTFTVRLPNGGTTEATLSGTTEYRRSMWERRDELIGKMLTVQHEGYTDGNKGLRFPIAIEVRDYE